MTDDTVVRPRPLHPLLRDAPQRVLEVHFVSGRILQFAFPNHCQQRKAHAQPNRRKGGDFIELFKQHTGFGGRQ